MDRKKIIVVDDEKDIRALLRKYLENEGFAVTESGNGQEALDLVARNNYDLMVLDVMLPGADGFTVCREVRKNHNMPILMLTARGEEIDRVLGLEIGADDYMVKPFSPRELVARVKALFRRLTPSVEEAGKKMAFGALEIDIDAREVRARGEKIALTPKEFELLVHLAGHPGRAFSREQLLESVWGYDFYGDLRTVDTHVKKLREKLNRHAGLPECIATVWGVGYKFEAC